MYMVVQLFYSGTKVNKSTQKSQLVKVCMKRKAFQSGIIIAVWCIYVESIDDLVLEVRTLFAWQKC